MFDKVDLQIPFLPDRVSYTALLGDDGKTDPDAAYVDASCYDFAMVQLYRNVQGELVKEPLKAQKWDNISTGLSGIAVGFFPEGNGFYRWPHVRIKCSPAKLLQGHNVFGSEDPTNGIKQMIHDFAITYPKISEDLNYNDAEIRYLDCTYSCHVREFDRQHIYRVFRTLAKSDQKVSRHDDYLQLGAESERTRLKIYYKFQELLADLKNAKRVGDRHRQSVLSDQRLQDFALDLMRFEATIGHRKLDDLGIPRRLTEFLQFIKWFEETNGQPLCRHLWSVVFDPAFAQLEGRTMKNVNDDDIKAIIDTHLIKIGANGKPNKRLANNVFKTFRAIKMDGYDKLAKEDSSTFFDHVKYMVEDCGISKALLKNLGPDSNANVIPMIQKITVDFTNQRPDWWEEPKYGYTDHRRLPKGHLRLVS